MKKITLFASMLLVFGMSAQQIIYQEDFESYTVGDNVGEDTDIPPGFTSYDVDGDGFNWGLSNPVNFYQDMELVYTSNFIMSASYITEGAAGNGNQGSLNAHNILVLPKISIPEGAAGVEFTYYVGAGTSHNFFSETYYVAITTVNDEQAILDATPIFSETLPTPEGRVLTLNLDDYIGQEVYISFRHQTADQWMLGLDDFIVTATTLGVSDNVFENFSYFVNNNQLQLKANRPINTIDLYNVLGQQVLSKQLSKLDELIDLSALINGVYIVMVSIDGQNKSFKIYKN